jgi:metal-responsive CopG/Arc/MetJ family transcriptional regulator
MPISTVNFSVPEEVKQAFNDTFATENKSAIISRLMQQAVEERQRQRRRAATIDALLELRRTQRPASDAEVAEARHEGRP